MAFDRVKWPEISKAYLVSANAQHAPLGIQRRGSSSNDGIGDNRRNPSEPHRCYQGQKGRSYNKAADGPGGGPNETRDERPPDNDTPASGTFVGHLMKRGKV
jgi:hypothetical protein